MFRKKRIVFCKQYDAMDCGAACLKMIASYYGKKFPLSYLRNLLFVGREGSNLLNLSIAAENIGLKTLRAKLSENVLIKDCPLPCILHWNQDHYVVLYGKNKNLRGKIKSYKIADPGFGLLNVPRNEFLKRWCHSTDERGIALLLEPSATFYNIDPTPNKDDKIHYIYKYLRNYKFILLQLLLVMTVVSGLSLVMPFMTQTLIDYGINGKNIDVIYLVLYAQLFLFIGSLAMQFIQSWLVLHINTRISLNIVSDFLSKLLNLPIRYFDSKTAGDITQRINDHKKVEEFLTSQSINSFFSFINIIVLSVVLGFYGISFILLFWSLTILSICWVFIFQKKRRNLNYIQFKINKDNRDLLNEIIFGMQEIKLNGAEKSKRWNWEHLQISAFKINVKGLSIEQYQRSGYILLNQLKNILITFIAAKCVLNGHLTLGMLLSISYIIGQTNGPIDQLVSFIKSAQDAILSIKRMNEVHALKDEKEDYFSNYQLEGNGYNGDILVKNVSFQYEGPMSRLILKDLNIKFKKGTVTALVGESGSGKTTLLKLLLGYYQPTSGEIIINESNLKNLNPHYWREQCGVIMQDGYIFTDSITGNIILGSEELDTDRMDMAISISNVDSFVEEKPLGYQTKIGPSGVGLSGGQKQRILIARAVYKDPNYLFLDEATSSLDANNEREIMNKLETFYVNKTVVVIAHRLSTVKNADQIIVLKDGQIVEIGNHSSLVSTKGYYYELIKNQLELAV